ncbi:transporter substrate-binding domain-containing protein [Limobrevibacterium gyesilva]|uniref:Transporter substrate-binding domain-containing protein n=1 Tax=Limobrevibacterium gyesilva TaxID=2991712 RepID=A0AA42CEP4_9PROT|nr:transporter substrate-binding domain-containing protein [Limobrevibacterium gyesilva]MCW3475549.1 transporter substrate-binding domain-containing protein [Limobrevibacterium gyesilva]
MKRLMTLALAGLCLCALAPAHADVLDNIMAAKKIRIATDLAIPPAGMVDDKMQPTGSDVETARLLAKDWGVELEFVQTTGATRIPNVQTGKADIIISTLSVTADRAKVIDFSKAYAVLQSVIGAKKDLALKGWADMKGRTVAVTRGTTQDTELSAMANDHGFRVVRYDDDATLVTAAVTGQADIVATSASLVNQMGQKNPARGFEPKFVIRNFDLAVGIKKGEPRLVEKLNEWISVNLKNGNLNAIFKKYYGTDLPAEMRG